MDEYAIIVENVKKSFNLKNTNLLKRLRGITKSKNNKISALDDITFKVPKGQILSLIGMNGSGKTTLLRVITGIYKPDSGTVMINGRSL